MVNNSERVWLYSIIILLVIIVGFSIFRITTVQEVIEEGYQAPEGDAVMNNYRVVVTHFGGYDGQIDYDNKVVSIWGGHEYITEMIGVHEFEAYKINSVLVKDVDVLNVLSVKVYENDEYLDGLSVKGRSNYLFIEF
jgi:hypothetical protein